MKHELWSNSCSKKEYLNYRLREVLLRWLGLVGTLLLVRNVEGSLTTPAMERNGLQRLKRNPRSIKICTAYLQQ